MSVPWGTIAMFSVRPGRMKLGRIATRSGRVWSEQILAVLRTRALDKYKSEAPYTTGQPLGGFVQTLAGAGRSRCNHHVWVSEGHTDSNRTDRRAAQASKAVNFVP